jgi:hypothetical protein
MPWIGKETRLGVGRSLLEPSDHFFFEQGRGLERPRDAALKGKRWVHFTTRTKMIWNYKAVLEINKKDPRNKTEK